MSAKSQVDEDFRRLVVFRRPYVYRRAAQVLETDARAWARALVSPRCQLVHFVYSMFVSIGISLRSKVCCQSA